MVRFGFALCGFALAAALASAASHADIVVGDYRAAGSGPALRFSDAAQGNAAPAGAFYSSASNPGGQMQTPLFLTYEPVENVIYVSDFYGQAIRVYAAGASGDAVPLRVLTSPSMGQPRRAAISVQNDELIAAVSGCCVAAYPRGANGAVGATRFLQWGGSAGSVTRLNNPGGVALRESSDEIFVPDYGTTPPSTYFGVVLVFARTAQGNTAPSRTIEGAATLLGNDAFAVAYDAVHDELIVASQDASQAFRVSVFAGSASGNAAPLHSLSGASTLLDTVHQVAVDPAGTIYVAEGGDNGSVARVLAFARGADGDVAPARVITGGATGVSAPNGIDFVPLGTLFANGFDVAP